MLYRIWNFAVHHKKALLFYYDTAKTWFGKVKSHAIRDLNVEDFFTNFREKAKATVTQPIGFTTINSCKFIVDQHTGQHPLSNRRFFQAYIYSSIFKARNYLRWKPLPWKQSGPCCGMSRNAPQKPRRLVGEPTCQFTLSPLSVLVLQIIWYFFSKLQGFSFVACQY